MLKTFNINDNLFRCDLIMFQTGKNKQKVAGDGELKRKVGDASLT